MRFYEDTKYYYFSTNPATDEEERSAIVRQGMEYFKEEMAQGFKPERSPLVNIIKYSGIAVFLGAIALMVYFSSTKNVAGVLYTFAGLFIVFGIFAAIPSKTPQKDLPGRAKMPRFLASALIISFGLGVLVPAILAPVYGFSKAAAGCAATWFTLGGLFFVFHTLVRIVRQARTKGNTVAGRCIGYIKMIESSNASTVNYQRTYIIGAPVFEYYYNGETYRAFQDESMRSGILKPSFGESVELSVDPSDPYNICHSKNTAARSLALALGLIALAAGIGLFCFLPSINDNNGFSVNTRGGQVRLAKAKFDDDLIESYIKTSDFTISCCTVVSSMKNGENAVVELSDGSHDKIPGSDMDKYYEGAVVYVVKPAGGGAGINFMADEWEYTGSREIRYS